MSAALSDLPPPLPLRHTFPVWLRIGILSFGGPAAQIALMHKVLVEERRWIDEQRFLHALSYCMLLPGPEATQLATYVGWLMQGARGGLMAGLLFIAPGIATMLVLSLLYARFGAVPGVQALFFGLKAAVLAIVVQAVWRLSSRALKGPLPFAIAGTAFLLIFAGGVPFPWIIAGAALLGFAATPLLSPSHAPEVPLDPPAAGRRRASWIAALLCLIAWLAPVAALFLTLGRGNVFTDIALFFSKAALVTFGGAYAVLAYVAQQAVEQYGWLSHGAMLDGLGLAETTPGPLIMVLQFVGFLAGHAAPGGLPPWLAGTLAALLATWVTFAPSFLWIFAGAPFVETLRGNRRLAGALSAITAAVVGVILNLAMWFAVRTLFARQVVLGDLTLPVPQSADPWAWALMLAAAVALVRFRAGIAWVLAGCSAAGFILHLAGVLPA